MKKIMFNDNYGLTKAVLEGRKTQTRRIVPESALIDWEIHDKYHNLSDAVGHRMDFEYFLLTYARYEVGEEVAVAQSYSQMMIRETLSMQEKLNESFLLDKFEQSKGWSNKMFVEAKYMPRRIKITNIRVERLQDISDKDCFAEGVQEALKHIPNCEPNDLVRDIFSTLIDKTCGKGTWDSNPWVFVYDFELIK